MVNLKVKRITTLNKGNILFITIYENRNNKQILLRQNCYWVSRNSYHKSKTRLWDISESHVSEKYA